MKKVFSLLSPLMAVALLVPSISFAAEETTSSDNVTIMAGFELEREPNDTFENANSLIDRIGTISSESDVDYYRFNTGSLWTAKSVTVNLTNIPSNRNYELVVYDVDKKVIGQSFNSGNSNESVTIPTVANSRYYIRVHSIQGYSTNEYYALSWDKNY